MASCVQMVGGLDLAYTLSQTGAGCTTNRAAGPCKGSAKLGNLDEYYMLVVFTDGTKWRQIAGGRLNSGYAVISVTYCAAAAGAILRASAARIGCVLVCS